LLLAGGKFTDISEVLAASGELLPTQQTTIFIFAAVRT
jgi:hypothetical protein